MQRKGPAADQGSQRRGQCAAERNVCEACARGKKKGTAKRQVANLEFGCCRKKRKKSPLRSDIVTPEAVGGPVLGQQTEKDING